MSKSRNSGQIKSKTPRIRTKRTRRKTRRTQSKSVWNSQLEVESNGNTDLTMEGAVSEASVKGVRLRPKGIAESKNVRKPKHTLL